MANPTTNYSFAMPTNTDLVKDLPADFEVFGQAVDTKLKALNPSTTLGDIEYRSATADTNTRLGIGTTGQVLSVSGGVPAWSDPAGGAANWSLLNSGGTALTGAQTVTISGISGKDKIMILFDKASGGNLTTIGVRLNADTGSNYYRYGYENNSVNTFGSNTLYRTEGVRTVITLCENNVNGNDVSGYVLLSGCNSSGVKVFNSIGAINSDAGSGGRSYGLGGYYNSATAISSVSIFSSVGNLDGGTIFVYTSA
jgi:hypothetical protein